MNEYTCNISYNEWKNLYIYIILQFIIYGHLYTTNTCAYIFECTSKKKSIRNVKSGLKGDNSYNNNWKDYKSLLGSDPPIYCKRRGQKKSK